jgi:copper chaperone CopZ
MQVAIGLQNIHCDGCVRNVENALKLIEGVREVRVDRAKMEAVVVFSSPATAESVTQQLSLGGYLAE